MLKKLFFLASLLGIISCSNLKEKNRVPSSSRLNQNYYGFFAVNPMTVNQTLTPVFYGFSEDAGEEGEIFQFPHNEVYSLPSHCRYPKVVKLTAMKDLNSDERDWLGSHDGSCVEMEPSELEVFKERWVKGMKAKYPHWDEERWYEVVTSKKSWWKWF